MIKQRRKQEMTMSRVHLLLLLISATSCFLPSLSAPSSDSYQFILYVSRWPGTFQEHPIPKYVDTFTLHGMWPSNNNGSYPSDCNASDPFNVNDIKSILQPLRVAWYDFDGPNSTSLWTHEWDKHGTCCTNVLPTQLDFFTEAINLHTYLNSSGVLAEHGIIPSRDNKYSLKNIQAALTTRIPGVTPIVTCDNKYDKICLFRVEYCFNIVHGSAQIFQCAEEFLKNNPSNCPQDGIYLPTINFL